MQGVVSSILALLIYISSFLGLIPSAGSQDGSESPMPPYIPPVQAAAPAAGYPGATEVMAYYAERFAGDPLPRASLQRAARALTTVIPFSLHVDGAGRLNGSVNQSVLRLARANGLKVLALVHNAGNGRFDPGSVHVFLRNAEARKRFINGLYNLLVQNGLDGVNLDLENVPAADRPYYTTLVRDLAMRLRPRHFLVTASLPAKAAEDWTSRWTGAYDYRALAPYLDQVVLMAYDEHVAGGDPGPVASLQWVESVVRYAVTVFPRQKIVLGLPAYGYSWSSRGDRALSFKQVSTVLRQNGASPAWDYRAQVPYFQYTKSGARHLVWYENSRSAAAKAALARRYGLRGVAVWRLGYEDPALWQTVASVLS